jgi:hypothetical protein
MQLRFISFMSISLLIVATVHAAAESSKALIELPKFKTEADIPNKTQLQYKLAGFLAGSTQQAATFISITHIMESENASVLGILGEWIISLGASMCIHEALATDIKHLSAHKTECASMIFNKLAPLGISPNSQEVATRETRLQNFIEEYRAGRNHTSDVRNAYNALLESNIQWQSFWDGYACAAILGPIPSLAVACMLVQLVK